MSHKFRILIMKTNQRLLHLSNVDLRRMDSHVKLLDGLMGKRMFDAEIMI